MELENSIYLKPRVEEAHEVHPLILNRWSPRSFSKDQVTKDHLFSILEAARWAPSSMNEQPWRFVYSFKGDKAFDDICSTLMEGNRIWAKEASVLLVTVIKENFTNSEKYNNSALHDLGLAVGNMGLQATELNIGMHQLGGFFPEKAESLLNIPNGYKAVTAIAMGYFGDPDSLEEPFRSREKAIRNRKPLSEISFHGVFKD